MFLKVTSPLTVIYSEVGRVGSRRCFTGAYPTPSAPLQLLFGEQSKSITNYTSARPQTALLIGTLEFWNLGILAAWNLGVSGTWNLVILESWTLGELESWNLGNWEALDLGG